MEPHSQDTEGISQLVRYHPELFVHAPFSGRQTIQSYSASANADVVVTLVSTQTAIGDLFALKGPAAPVQLTHVNAAFTRADGTAISADGRFVAFTGYEVDGAGTERWNVYAIDRQLQASFDISVRTDGSRDDNATAKDTE